MNFVNALSIFVALAGFPALLTIVISILKAVGWLPDGKASVVVFWASVAAFVGVAVLVFLGKSDSITQIDSQMDALSKVLAYFAAFATELGLTKVYYKGLRGLPIVGYSHSVEEEKKS